MRSCLLTVFAAALLMVGTPVLKGQPKSSFVISNLRTGEISLDKAGLSVPFTVDFEISPGIVTNTISFLLIKGSKGVGSVCGSGNGPGEHKGTVSCTWKDPKFKAPKNATQPFKLSLVTPYGDTSNTLEGTVTLP